MESTDTAGKKAPAPLKMLTQKIKGLNRLFLLTVVLPTALAIIYYGFLASDIYISESRFVIRSPQKQSPTGLGAILQGAGFSKSQDDTYTVQDYIQSRDALKELNEKLDIAAAYGAPGYDRISRFGGTKWWDKSFEALHRYYLKNIVTINHDSASSITTVQVRAFAAEQAAGINEQLLDMSERLVNNLNERGRQDMIRFATAEVATAEKKAKAASLALSAYRSKKGVFDPEKQSAIQLQQISRLQDELIATKTQLTQIRSISKNNPQVATLQTRVEVLESVIAAETAKVVGGGSSLSGSAAEYERLTLERGFADKQLAAALSTLEQARNDAMRKQLYLERIVLPGTPDRATEPRRLKMVFAIFIVGMITWGILTMLIAGVREHND